MEYIIILFSVYIFNLLPAFTPPTWMVLAFISLKYHPYGLLLAFVGAVAATLGRLTLAKFSDVVIRKRVLSQTSIRNVDVIREYLQRKTKLTFGFFLFYAFSPFPSNQLFIAYGLTDLPLRRVSLPFFIGRFLSYLFWVLAASEVEQRIAANAFVNRTFFGSYFVFAQILSLFMVYLFTKIDWRRLIDKRNLRFIKINPLK